MTHHTSETRYGKMIYNRCGKSGLKLPAISLGLWQHFGETDVYATCKAIVLKAFDLGVTHFDLANNYGIPPGSSEEIIGKILHRELRDYRDEILITTKAGYDMWPGPYGEWGSKKYLAASLDQSLKRMGLEYVDMFYSHRPDPDTPLEETMGALDLIVRQGKALYVGISNYRPGHDARSRQDTEKPGHALPDPSAQLFHFQPMDRRRAPEFFGGRRTSGPSFSNPCREDC